MNNATAFDAGAWSEIHNVVRATNRFFIVFNHYYRITNVSHA